MQIGGTAAAPNITLNASGSASFEGKVGIGTTSPSTVFHVVGANSNDATTLATAASDAKIRLQKSDISGLSKFQGTTDTGTCWYSQIANGNGSTAYNHVINPFGGNVGIGTTSPSQLLDVNGSATFAGKITAASTEDTDGGDTVVTKDYLEGAGSGGTGTLGYWDRTGTTLSPVNDGDAVSGVDWDITTAQENWYVKDGFLAIAKDGTPADDGAIAVYSGAGTNSTFRVRADGGVELGGTLPSAPNISLNASGSAEFAGDVQVGGDAVSTEGCYIGSNGTLKAARDDANAVFVGRSTTSNSATFQISGDGTVGIGGTLPSAPNISLNADGSIVATATTGSNVGELFVNSGGLALRTNRAPSAVSNLLDLQSSNSGTTESIAAFTTSGDLQIGGTLTGDSRTPNISLTAAGKITAADYDLEALPPLP